MWETWDRYTRDSVGPLTDQAFYHFTTFKADLLTRIANTRCKDKRKWEAMVEAACQPTPPKPQPQTPQTKRLPGTSLYPQPYDCPRWTGLDDNEPERKIVGLVWSRKVGRWAVRITTRLGEYIDTQTVGVDWKTLAVTIDHIKCAFLTRGYFSAGWERHMKKSAWNDLAFAKEKIGCGYVELDEEKPLHKRALDWLERVAVREKMNAGGRGSCTLHAVPTQAAMDAHWKRMTQLD